MINKNVSIPLSFNDSDPLYVWSCVCGGKHGSMPARSGGNKRNKACRRYAVPSVGTVPDMPNINNIGKYCQVGINIDKC